MCSSSHCNLPAAAESQDLVAVIHPHLHPHATPQQQHAQSLSRIPRSRALAGRMQLSNRFAADVTTLGFRCYDHDHDQGHEGCTGWGSGVDVDADARSGSGSGSDSASSTGVSGSSSRETSRSPSPSPSPGPVPVPNPASTGTRTGTRTDPATLTLTIRIHKSGQSLALASAGESENPVVHSFAVSTEIFASVDRTPLGKRLDLGVGGEGVVGRTVSVVGVDGRVLGEGIIGIGGVARGWGC